jgi:hypothetical protein
MSEIIELIISYVIATLLSLAIIWLVFRKIDKDMSNHSRTTRKHHAARRQSLKEVRADKRA